MQNSSRPASEPAPPRQAAPATRAKPFRIIPGSAYCALWRILHNAHGLRDLAGLYRFDPEGQLWARSMADLLIDANAQATAARAAGQASLDDAQLARIRSWYRGAVAKGLADNQHRRTQIAKDGLTLARRFRACEDMILRFATHLAVGFTSDLASYCTSCGGWRVRGLAGRSGRCGAGGLSIAGGSDIFPRCAGAPGFAVGVAAA